MCVYNVLRGGPLQLIGKEGNGETRERYPRSDATDDWALAIAAHPSRHYIRSCIEVDWYVFNALGECIWRKVPVEQPSAPCAFPGKVP